MNTRIRRLTGLIKFTSETEIAGVSIKLAVEPVNSDCRKNHFTENRRRGEIK